MRRGKWQLCCPSCGNHRLQYVQGNSVHGRHVDGPKKPHYRCDSDGCTHRGPAYDKREGTEVWP